MLFKKLTIKNFMGTESAEIDFGDLTIISGDNATGKTTLLSAITWCLFGKDYFDRAKFNLQRIDEDGSVCNDEVTVSLVIEHNGETVNITRIFDGNTKFYVNDIPMKATAFNDYVSALTDGLERFKLYANPLYFFKLVQKEQRDTMMRFFPTPKDEVVLSQLETIDVALLSESLKKNTPENIILVAKDKINAFEKEAFRLKAIIDAKPISTIVETSEELADKLKTLDNYISAYSDNIQKCERTNNDIELAKASIEAAHGQIKHYKDCIEIKRKEKIEELTRKMNEYEKESDSIDVESTICPTCGSEYPESKKELLLKTRDMLHEKVKEFETLVEQVKLSIDKEVSPYTVTEIEHLETIIAEKNGLAYTEKIPVEDLKDKMQGYISEHTGLMCRYHAARAQEKYAEELDALKTSYKDANLQKEKYENIKSAAERFISKRCEIVVEKLNSMFKTIKIELFETLKDGSKKESFNITCKGVPYESLNKGSKLAAGIELSLFLQNGLGISVPTIIDDGESYSSNKYMNIPNQVIVTKVVEGQEFKVEVVR